MSKYKHLFFDLDHTLWDYQSNSRDTLEELYHAFELSDFNKFTVSQFINQFETTNEKLWRLFDQGLTNKDFIREKRFDQIFERLGLGIADVPIALSDTYLKACPLKTKVIPFSFEVLKYLKNKYNLHILTNGFAAIQTTKLKYSNLSPYFDLVIDAESTLYKKPQKEIFLYAIAQAKARKEECIMIGDNLNTDILGAKNAVMDQVFFNPKSINHEVDVTFEVACLSELKTIF